MSNSKLLSALFFAAPVALYAAGCSAEVQTSKSTSTSGGTTTQVSLKSNGHGPDDGHGHANEEAKTPATAPVTAPEKTPSATTSETPSGNPSQEELTQAGSTTEPSRETSKLPEGHSEDDGHDHGAEAPISGPINNPPPLGDGTGPRLVYPVGKESHSFGRVMEGTVAGHTFELTNDGTEDLIIKQVKPTCGCTVAQVQIEGADGEMAAYTFGDPIPPKAKVNFPAKLHTKNKSGHQTTRINIFSNDPRGTIQLGLDADIDPFFSIAPKFLNFGQISVGDVVNKKVVISTTKGTPVGLSLIEQSLPAGTLCDLTPVNPDAEGRAMRWDLSVTLGPDLTEGNLARAINISSDVEIPGADPVVDGTAANYAATLTLSAQVVGPFSYNPPYLSMGLVRPGQVATRTVTIESHDETYSFATTMPKIQVVGLQNPVGPEGGATTFREWEYADRFTPIIRPVEGKNAIEVELRLEGLPDNATGSFRGTLLVDLNHPDKEQIQLVITGVCRGGPAPEISNNGQVPEKK